VVYRRQNRLARAAATRALIGVVLRDSRQIYYVTLESAIEVAESGIRAFRKKLGSSADACTFRRYFFQKNNFVVWSSFMTGYMASPAYSRLSNLWDEIDQASSELRGALKILHYSAQVIAENSRRACQPTVSFILAPSLVVTASVSSFQIRHGRVGTRQLGIVPYFFDKKLHKVLDPNMQRLEYMVSFVEGIYAVISEMTDRSVLSLSSDRKPDWYCLDMLSGTRAASESASVASASINGSSSASVTSVVKAPAPQQTPSDLGAVPTYEGSAAEVASSMAAWNDMREKDEKQEKKYLDLIEHLLVDLRLGLPVDAFGELKTQVEGCKKTYEPDHQSKRSSR
jgi:hypothetical protein